ncbi:hypothetical protein [Flavitalea sp.]|nr:hypothetical protein [Flavitalea sp.]
MKATRIICLVFAWLWIAVISLVSIGNFSDLPDEDIAYSIGIFIGSALFLIPSFILFFIAGKIKKKLERAKRDALINSFESI